MKRIATNGCLFALAVATTAAAQTLSLVPRGGMGNSISLAPGGLVIIDVYAQDVAPDLLRAYQVTLPLTAADGVTGSVSHDGTVPSINTVHPDYVFATLTASGTGSNAVLPLVVNAVQFVSDSVFVTTPRYLGEFRYNVSATASGTFTINAVDPGINPSANDSFLVDRNDAPIAFTTVPAQIEIAPSLVLNGNGAGSTVMTTPGSTVTVEVFLHASSPDRVRAYQATFPAAATGGAAGSVTHDGNVPTIDTGHPEYIFDGLTAFPVGSLNPIRVVNALQNEPDSVEVTTGLYAGELVYAVSPDADGTFEIDLVDPGTDPAVNDSFIVLADLSRQSAAVIPAALKTRKLTIIVAEATCVDQDDCDDDDVCTWDQCTGSGCTHTSNIYGDVNHDGVVDVFDILCVLDGFSGAFSTCTFPDVDLQGCPAGDGVVDVFDILAVLDAFSGVNSCGCPAGP